MKKLLFIFALILGCTFSSNAQELFGSATNKGMDGYLTGGYIKKGWGAYVGFKYDADPMVSTKTGSFDKTMKFGVVRMFASEKLMLGVGIQPVENVNKPNVWIGYAPLKSEGLKIWVIGNLVGSNFSPGLGITYKLSTINF
jgi:hypothetical protein